MLVLVTILMVSERSLILQERQASVRQAVETAHGVIAHFHEQASKGALTEDEAKQRAMAAVRALRYSGNEYFWINDMQPKMLMHPISTKLDGKISMATRIPRASLFVEFVDTVKKMVPVCELHVAQTGERRSGTKGFLVKGFAPLGLDCGSGVYVDTVQATFSAGWGGRGGHGGAGLGFGSDRFLDCTQHPATVGWRARIAQCHYAPHRTGDLAVDIPHSTDESSVIHGIQSMRDNVASIVTRVRQV